MAFDQSKCYIGVLARPLNAPFVRKYQYNTWSSAQAATNTYPNPWPLWDGAWTPDFDLVGGSDVYIYGGATTLNSDLSPLPHALVYGYYRINSPSFSVPVIYTAGSGGSYSSGGYGPGVGAIGSRSPYIQTRAMVDLLSQSYWEIVAYEQITGRTILESRLAIVQELPYAQELVSYKRTQTAPAVHEVKTLDGVIRRTVTGLGSTALSATFTWSDDGTIAANLALILAEATDSANPLVVYIPSVDGQQRRYLDLVIPSAQPDVVSVAPGVYRLTIEGTCQP